MRKLLLATFLSFSTYAVSAQDATMSDVMNRNYKPLSQEAAAFIRAYGSPTQELIEKNKWKPAVLPRSSSLLNVPLTTNLDTSKDTYSLMVDPNDKLMYLLDRSGVTPMAYGPVVYPRGI